MSTCSHYETVSGSHKWQPKCSAEALGATALTNTLKKELHRTPTGRRGESAVRKKHLHPQKRVTRVITSSSEVRVNQPVLFTHSLGQPHSYSHLNTDTHRMESSPARSARHTDTNWMQFQVQFPSLKYN